MSLNQPQQNSNSGISGNSVNLNSNSNGNGFPVDVEKGESENVNGTTSSATGNANAEVARAHSNRESTSFNFNPAELLKVRPVTIEARNLRAKAGKAEILKGIDVHLEPGTITALMGPSGAGKTTLLNVLSGRAQGYNVTCDQLKVNGQQLKAKNMQELSCLVPQHDILIAVLTPRETFHFTSKLVIPGTKQEHLARVEQVLKILSLNDCADVINGDQDIKGLSGGERKRVSIGIELITNPSCLFLDEPTSGLDSKIAMDVVTVLRGLSKQGRTIVCTIHQPSYEVFAKFQNLVLLCKGELVYNGAANEIDKYLSSIGYPVGTYSNPADYMLTVVSEKQPKGFASFNEAFRQSDHGNKFFSTWKKLENGGYEAPPNGGHVKVVPSTADMLFMKKGTSIFNQFCVLVERSIYVTLRDKRQLRMRSIQMIIMGLIIGLSYLQLDKVQTAIFDRRSALILFCTFYTMSSVMGTIIAIPMEKTVLKREYQNGFYGPFTFASARLVVFYLFQIWYLACLVCIAYPMVGFQTGGGHMIVAFGVLILLGFLAVSLGFVFSTLLPTVQQSIAVVPTIVLPLMLFSGLFIAPDNIPVYFIWLYYLSFIQYTYQVLTVNEFETLEFKPCTMEQRLSDGACPLGPCNSDKFNISLPAESCSGKIVLDQLDYNVDEQWKNVVTLLGLWCAASLLSLYTMRKFLKK